MDVAPPVPPGRGPDPGPEHCELCEAAPITERYHDDDLCWVAECESCFVPMVVWKQHDPNPPEEIRAELQKQLTCVADEHFRQRGLAWWFDDTLRSIPHHYHAHARPRGRFTGQGSS